MATLIEALPTFTSQEQLQEHQSATPSSFNIAPVLRRKVENCNLVLRPNKIEGLSYAETGITGDLYVSEGSLVFWSEALKKGLEVTYPTITLHAISRQPMKPWVQNDAENTDESDAAPNPEANGEHPEDLTSQQGGACIFCQLDFDTQELDMDDEAYESTDLILTPPESDNIDDIFADFCHCASLFPSTMDDDAAEEPVLGMGQMDDAEEPEPEENETGAAMTEEDWDAKVDWSTAPPELRQGAESNTTQEEQFEDAESERPAQGDAKKPRLE